MDLTRRSLLTATDLTTAEFSHLVALVFEGASTGVPVVATFGRGS